MSQRPSTSRNIVPAIFGLTGFGIFFMLAKYRKNILHQLRLAYNFRNPIRNKTVEVIHDYDRCVHFVSVLQRHCNEYKVLGFDCEWVTVGGSRRPIALLQLASHRGLCALIRLCRLPRIPKELRDLLEDDRILKVGVAPHDDSIRLSYDYGIGVESTLDLRHLAVLADEKPEGLAKMSKSILDVELDKHWRIRCSDWEAPELSDRQKEYAALDALMAVEIFKVFDKKITKRKFWENQTKHWTKIDDICQRYIDIKFTSAMISSGMIKNPKKLLDATKRSKGQPSKQFTRKLCTRTKRLYDNCFLQAPDGEILCTIEKRKADWYVNQSLGCLISEDPYTVRLNFEPAGRAVGNVGKYYTIEKVNQCVVCGRKDAYIRKNVVPREYRKHFPLVMKTHTSHDVLLMCPHCHQISNISDLKVRNLLAKMCDAPLQGCEGGRKYLEVPKLRSLRKAARALLNNFEKIPEERQQVLRNEILEDYPNGTEVTAEILKELANMEVIEEVENYCAHGVKVVNYFTGQSGGLIELEKIWREHFLKEMRPKFLPDLWSVMHNADRMEIRANEGRINIEDLIAVGLDLSKHKQILK